MPPEKASFIFGSFWTDLASSLEKIGDIRLAARQHREPRRLLRNALEDDALDRRRFAPIVLVRLHHQFEAGLHADEFVRSEADRVLQETFVADLFDIVLRYDPAGGADERPVIRHEIRPRLLQDELHRVRIDDFDFFHLFTDQRRLGALEAELDVFRGERVAVVELDALAQLEFVGELVRAFGPRIPPGSAPSDCPASALPARRAARTGSRTGSAPPASPPPGPSTRARSSRRAPTSSRLPVWPARLPSPARPSAPPMPASASPPGRVYAIPSLFLLLPFGYRCG